MSLGERLDAVLVAMQGIVALLLAFRGGGWGIGLVGVIGIIFGLLLIANYTAPGMGLALIWVAAVWGLVGGVLMIIQAFRQRSATLKRVAYP